MTVQIAAVLLAGGENRRMRHQEKFSLPFQGSTFGGHLLTVLRETLPGVPVYLSVGSEKTQPETDVLCIPDECPNLGPAGGILSAMHRIAAEALLVLACDMPFVDGPLLQKLLRAYEQSRKLTLVCAADTDGLSAHADGRTLPFPGIYPLRLLPCFEQAAEQRDGALRRIIRQTEAAEGIERVCLPAQSRCLESINTPYVYQALMGTLPPKKPATELSDAVRLLREAVRQPAHDTAGDAKRKAALHPADETVLRTVPLLSALGEILAEDVFAVRDQPYFVSNNRQIRSLRKLRPFPLVRLHPETAARYGIREGDWIWIENEKGRITQKAELVPQMRKDVVNASFAWWYPEAGAPGYGWDESNANLLTSADGERDAFMGSYRMRALLCRVYPNPGCRIEERYRQA